nr:basic helix-loop-helix protein [Polyrhizophydium stewartii]
MSKRRRDDDDAAHGEDARHGQAAEREAKLPPADGTDDPDDPDGLGDVPHGNGLGESHDLADHDLGEHEHSADAESDQALSGAESAKTPVRAGETITEGIKEISRLIPEGEIHKGRVLQRAAAYILELKQQLAADAEKWSMERTMMEQIVSDLTKQNERLKEENKALRVRLETSSQMQAASGDSTADGRRVR